MIQFILFLFLLQDPNSAIVNYFSDEIILKSNQSIFCKIIKIEGLKVSYLTIKKDNFKVFEISADTVKQIKQNGENIVTSIKRDSIVTYWFAKSDHPGLQTTIDSSALISEGIVSTDITDSEPIIATETDEWPLYIWITLGTAAAIPILYLLYILIF